MKPALFRMRKGQNSKNSLLWPIIIISFFIPAMTGVLSAQEKYPSKPIVFLVGYAPGGATDVTCRAIASAASKHLGQPFIMTNKPGGSSAVAMGILMNEKPDGYTISHLGAGAIVGQHMRKLNFDTAKSFSPIIQFGETLNALAVRSDSPWKTWKEFIEYARANPGKIRYSSYGPGSVPSLVMEQVALREKIKWTHIPFEGTNPATSALLGGHVEAIADNIIWKPHVIAGRLRVLANFNERPLSFAPNVPTLMELYGIDCPIPACIVGPKGLSPKVVEILHGAFKKAMEDPDFIQGMDIAGSAPRYRSSEELAQFLVRVNEDFRSWLRDLGLLKK